MYMSSVPMQFHVTNKRHVNERRVNIICAQYFAVPHKVWIFRDAKVIPLLFLH